MLRRLFKAKKAPANGDASSRAQTAPMDLFRARGDDRAQHRDYNGAAMMYDEALRYAPTDTTILLSRSFAHMMSTPPRLDLALQDADAAIQHSPTNWQGWLQKGDTHLRMGDINGAEEALVNAVGFAQGVDKFTAQRLLADVQARRGQSSSAAEPSGTSQSTIPTLLSQPSLATASQSAPTTLLSHPHSMATLIETTAGSAAPAHSNTPPSGKRIPFSYSQLNWYQPSSVFSFDHSDLSCPAGYADIFHDKS